VQGRPVDLPAAPRAGRGTEDDVKAASLRFTLDSLQWWSTVGRTATLPSRAAGGIRSHPTKPATSSACDLPPVQADTAEVDERVLQVLYVRLDVVGDRSIEAK